MIATVRAAKRLVHSFYVNLRLPSVAKAEARKDARGLPAEDPGIDAAIDEAAAWLCRAQDCSASADGGVARHYSLLSGWGPSYPETTGYIIPTMLAYARLRSDSKVRERARRMLQWLVSIQFPCGGFQGGSIGSTPVVPVTFNTGQIILGLAGGVREFGEYREELLRAADWLVRTQDPDGCWRKHPTPFAAPGEKAYETHVAWGLFEADRIEPGRGYAQAADANVRWALKQQRINGWFENCGLTDSSQPLTHTIGYALRGVIEAYRFTKDGSYLRAAVRTADGLLNTIRSDGFLPGRISADWRGTVDWVCLTGTAQLACCWLMLFQYTQEPRYRKAAYAANRFVRRSMRRDGPPGIRGGVAGSFPLSGGYGTYSFLSWAGKFAIDANILMKEINGRMSGNQAGSLDDPDS